MNQRKDKRILPMNFNVLRNLEATVSINLLSLKSIGFLIDSIGLDYVKAEEVADFAGGAAKLLELWVENHMREVEKSVIDFENTDLFLLHSAQETINITDQDPSLRGLKIQRLKEALHNMNLILENPELPHSKALQLKTKCEQILGEVNV